MNENERLLAAKKVFDLEIDALSKTKDILGKHFLDILEAIIECNGKLIITGIGKPGHVATKLAATFSSLGTPAFYLHPGEAMHGDLGMISESDVVMIISYSGESDEIINILPNIKIVGAKIVAVTGNERSTLAEEADYVQLLPDFEEACAIGLAPTSSTTAELCLGDAWAVVASECYGFTKEDFGRLHPAGALGKKLVLRVYDLMATGDRNAVINHNASMTDAINELSSKGLGIVSVIDEDYVLKGVITDGDLRRQLKKHADIYALAAKDVMSCKPHMILQTKFAIDALALMRNENVSSIPVVDSDEKVVGTIRLQDIISAGIVA